MVRFPTPLYPSPTQGTVMHRHSGNLGGTEQPEHSRSTSSRGRERKAAQALSSPGSLHELELERSQVKSQKSPSGRTFGKGRDPRARVCTHFTCQVSAGSRWPVKRHSALCRQPGSSQNRFPVGIWKVMGPPSHPTVGNEVWLVAEILAQQPRSQVRRPQSELSWHTGPQAAPAPGSDPGDHPDGRFTRVSYQVVQPPPPPITSRGGPLGITAPAIPMPNLKTNPPQ
ncbi:hypothetical protein TREES_T100007258 [Tupaia chinensis]|uniref:Uncharacterized protein n=1 Tax=Tupaia chinensis TaxID=246437 RepID=L9L0I2_TUPCH|nr:hypothetical protein TREES_T100007258 [Tupaia chinensis]